MSLGGQSKGTMRAQLLQSYTCFEFLSFNHYRCKIHILTERFFQKISKPSVLSFNLQHELTSRVRKIFIIKRLKLFFRNRQRILILLKLFNLIKLYHFLLYLSHNTFRMLQFSRASRSDQKDLCVRYLWIIKILSHF